MSSEHPYLFINDEMKLEWVIGTNARVKCIHQPDITYRKDLGLGSDELVTDFVRFNRNYYSVYTNKNKTYEIGPHGIEEIMLIGSGKGVTPVKYIEEINWKSRNNNGYKKVTKYLNF